LTNELAKNYIVGHRVINHHAGDILHRLTNHHAGDVNMLLYTINCCPPPPKKKRLENILASLIFKRLI